MSKQAVIDRSAGLIGTGASLWTGRQIGYHRFQRVSIALLSALVGSALVSACSGAPSWQSDNSVESTHAPFRWAITQCVGTHDPDQLQSVIAGKPYDAGARNAEPSIEKRAVAKCMREQGWDWGSAPMGF